MNTLENEMNIIKVNSSNHICSGIANQCSLIMSLGCHICEKPKRYYQNRKPLLPQNEA